MAEHDELVAEMPSVSKLSIQERLLLAKTRRTEQLKCYERQSKVNAHAQSVKRGTGRKSVRFDSKARLFEAATRNAVEEVRCLLKSGECHPNSTNSDGFTILHQCCIDGQPELVRSLIEDFGVSVNLPDQELWTPLHTVALCGRAQVSKLLIDHGADLLALNIDGNMPYDICDDEETLDIIEMEMSKRGITQERIEELRSEKERRMLGDLQRRVAKQPEVLERRGIHGETLLHIAAANGYTTVARFLLDAKVTVDTEDDDSWQPIHCAAKWRQLPVLELLIINGAKLTPKTADGATPLDLCSDLDIQTWMTELRLEMESKQSSLVNSHQRLLNIMASKSSVQMQTSGGECGSGSSQLYSSNISLADGVKASSSNRHLPNSEKESMSKRATLEESRIRLSLQSLDSAGQQPHANGVLGDELKNSTHNRSFNGQSILQPSDQNGNIKLTAGPSYKISSLSNGLNGHLANDPFNGTQKSCLRKIPSPEETQRQTDPSLPQRERKSAFSCCLIS